MARAVSSIKSEWFGFVWFGGGGDGVLMTCEAGGVQSNSVSMAPT